MAASGGVFPSDAQASTVVHPHVTLSLEEQTLIKEWASWHEVFGAIKDEFKNCTRVLNSIEE
ncbi:hypothetical protein DVH24_018766 [Malus domestica]|uniref:Uncharacterized protein n=1 Tax=Malus domestica TaxID=3750 RepID=A0A498HQH7_MALDO|nr:hypothetical protein DVH24_018766 [Malus domestica]